MSEKRFIVVKGCDNNVEKEGYFIQDTHYGVLKFGSFWKEKFAKEDCKRLNDVCELIEELHTRDNMGWERAKHFEKELKRKKIYIKRLEYKVQKFKEMNSEQQATLSALKEENEKLRFLIDINSVSERTKLERQVDEQQATIRKLQDLCGESDGENAKLRIENEKLRKELGDCEKFRYTVFQRLNEEYKKECSIR